MPRIPRARGLQSLRLASSSAASTLPRSSFAAARTLSTTAPACDLRSKLWQGTAPGPADPYTQRPEPEAPSSNLPEEMAPAARQPLRRAQPPSAQKDRLPLPPKRTEAPTEKEVAASDPTYVPAQTIEELEELPTLEAWWDQPENWGEESAFAGFGKADKELDRTVVEVHLRRAVVEALALQQEGRLARQVTSKWPEGSREALGRALAVDVVGQDGQFSLQGDVSAVVKDLVSSSKEEPSSAVTPEEAATLTQKWTPGWKAMVLNDEMKFVIRKRLYQLTGNLVSDAELGAAKTVQNLLSLSARRPKAPKLAALLESRPEVTSLPNVRVHGRKITPVDREVETGRWKVIEEELRRRGLPVLGTDNLPQHKERRWMRGEL